MTVRRAFVLVTRSTASDRARPACAEPSMATRTLRNMGSALLQARVDQALGDVDDGFAHARTAAVQLLAADDDAQVRDVRERAHRGAVGLLEAPLGLHGDVGGTGGVGRSYVEQR